MPSNAISAQGCTLEIGTGTGGAKTITAITKANPVSITSAAHGLQPGDVVTLSGIVGMVDLNGKTATVEYVTANSFTLAGVDSSGSPAYTSGGSATPVQWTQIAELKSLDGFDGSASEIDVTNLSSTAKEKRLGLMDYGGVSIVLSYVPADAGQQALAAAQQSGAVKQFRLKLPAGVSAPNTATWSGMVKSFSKSLGVDQVVSGKAQITISGTVTWA